MCAPIAGILPTDESRKTMEPSALVAKGVKLFINSIKYQKAEVSKSIVENSPNNSVHGWRLKFCLGAWGKTSTAPSRHPCLLIRSMIQSPKALCYRGPRKQSKGLSARTLSQHTSCQLGIRWRPAHRCKELQKASHDCRSYTRPNKQWGPHRAPPPPLRKYFKVYLFNRPML